ncbi:hypothetical protein T03_3831 [Trichinella britovi]|uniref:Uncharacterized protein n=1 Tax=Trichinella britovi TaxID=45882 RepID=A0A0V1C8S5_TRIBR|nr:hypothetical protein T03_3831 [Trichinella britovi]
MECRNNMAQRDPGDGVRWSAANGRTSQAINSASKIQAPNHPAKQSPGNRTADQGPSRQADACWCQSNIGSHQNKILDNQSQKRSKEDNPFMPGMS